jgi:hypothetical protein
MLIVETPLVSDFSGQHAERYKDIYHTLFFDHFTLGLAGALHAAEPTAMRNIVYFASDGSFNLNMQMRYERARKGTELARAVGEGDSAAVRLARSYQDVVQSSRLSLVVSNVERRLRRLSDMGMRLQARIRKKLVRSGA